MATPGSDYKQEVNIEDKNGTPINWSLLDDYAITVYHGCGKNKAAVFVFKKNGTGMNAIEIDSGDATKAYIILNRLLTATVPLKEIFLEVEIKIAQSGYLNGYAIEIETGVQVFKMDLSANPTAIQ
jgi:hypothetical protein